MTTGNNIPAEPQKVVRLSVTESDDPSLDAHLLREVIGVLLEYPGRDRVNLDIRTGERLVRMDLPVVSTGYCEGLHARLEELLGPDTVAVHQELGLGMEPPNESPVHMPLESAPPAVPDSTSPAGPDPAANENPEAAPEPSGVSESKSSEAPDAPAPEVPASAAAEVSATVGADPEGDEPPF